MSKVERRALAPERIFAALGDGTRLHLVQRLSDGRARSIVQLTDDLALSRQAVSKHLRVLARAGLVHACPSGRENRYSLAPEPLRTASSFLDAVGTQWEDALARLQAHVEDER